MIQIRGKRAWFWTDRNGEFKNQGWTKTTYGGAGEGGEQRKQLHQTLVRERFLCPLGGIRRQGDAAERWDDRTVILHVNEKVLISPRHP